MSNKNASLFSHLLRGVGVGLITGLAYGIFLNTVSNQAFNWFGITVIGLVVGILLGLLGKFAEKTS